MTFPKPTTNRGRIGAYAIPFLFAGLAVVLLHRGEDRMTAAMWAGACLGMGGVFGFLFGVPRTVSQGIPTPPPATPRPPANPLPYSPPAWDSPPAPADPGNNPTSGSGPSNLEQVSDWITKLLLGGGLTQLKEMPGLITSWGRHVAVGIAEKPESVPQFQVFATALILYFLILGFLAGYLITKIELSSDLQP